MNWIGLFSLQMPLQIIVTFVGIGTLIAGIIGISNIMVFIVKERTKELGIRKALGAEPNEIIKMILTGISFYYIIAGISRNDFRNYYS
jgi:putative ABC transport system permease protein